MKHGKAVVGLLALAVAFSCTLAVVLYRSRQPEASVRGRAVADDIGRLRADNGLYYSPELREPGPPAAYESAYGLGLLSEMGWESTPTPTQRDLDNLRNAERLSQPLFTRLYLARLVQIHPELSLDHDDATTVQGMRRPAGYYLDPRGPDDVHADEPVKLVATAAALEVLATARALGGVEKSRTAAWIHQNIHEFLAQPFLAWTAARALGFLAQPAPRSLLDASTDWYQRATRATEPAEYTALAHNLYGRAQLLRLFDQPPDSPSHWLELVRAAADRPDLQDAYYIGVAWNLMRGDRAELQPLVDRVDKLRQSTGLLGPERRLIGSVGATYEAAKLLQELKLPKKDNRLIDTLKSYTTHQRRQQDPVERAVQLLALAAAGGSVDQGEWVLARSNLLATLPSDVTLDNAAEWQYKASLLRSFRGPVPTPRPTPWTLDRPSNVVAAARLVVGLHDSGLPLTSANWISTESIRGIIRKPDPAVDTSGYLTAVLADIHLTGQVDASIVRLADRYLREQTGCAGLPHLVKQGRGSSVCSLAATSLAVRVSRLLRLPDAP